MREYLGQLRLRIGSTASVLVLLAACGGGSDSSAPIAVATTTNVTTSVIDGPIANATVCLDKNGSGDCAGQVQAITDAGGNATLIVPNSDVGLYPVVAIVDTTATDADAPGVKVPVRYVLSAPADHVGVVSPLTTLVQQTVATTGVSSAVAAQSIADATGISTSLFADYTKAGAATGSVNPATMARLIVLAAQRQAAAISGTIGTMAIDNTPIKQTDLDKATQKKLLELLPSLVAALSDPAVLAATTVSARDAALLPLATSLVASAGLTPASVPVVVAVNTQNAAPPAAVSPPAAFVQLVNLNFTSASDYFTRFLTGSLAQNTPDSSNNARYVDRHVQNVSGNLAKWGSGSNPARNGDLHWNGTAWVTCPPNFANTSSVRDAQGNNVYNFCDNAETGKSNRATFGLAGTAMASVYAQVRAAGFTNLRLADQSVLGAATFPAGSQVFYQTTTPLTEAFSYYPGSSNPAGLSDTIAQYSAAVTAGGDATTQGASAGCNSTEAAGNGTTSTTLEGMIAAMSGTPCLYAAGGFTYQGVFIPSGTPNEWWGNSTVSFGTIGNAPVGSGTAPGFFTTNTKIRLAFKGAGANAVTYYTCKERFNNGSTRNCVPIGTGSYSITTLGDARVMTFSNPPPQAAALGYNRVFVERGGVVYAGYQNRPNISNTARLNTIAATALMNQLGLTIDDPSVPLALVSGSYQGVWDLHDVANPIGGTTVFINSNGTTSCQDQLSFASFACAMSITNPATGAFTYTDSTTIGSGTADFMAGTASGTYHDSSIVPPDGSFVAHRR